MEMKSSGSTRFGELRLRSVLIALSLLIVLILAGMTGFMLIEGYTITEAFFMTIITMATVGFQEVHPLSNGGMLFTSILIIFSFGIFAYVVSSFTRFLVDGIFRNFYKDNKVKTKISRLKNHVIVCGFGRNGKQAVIELIDEDVEVVVIEKDEDMIENIRTDSELLYIHGDATQDEVLVSAKIDSALALITTLPIDADNLFVVLSAKELNPKLKIISSASEDHADVKLKRAGATNVIMSGKIGGQRMAKLVHQSDVVEFMEFIMLQGAGEVKLIELSCNNLAVCFNGKSIRELDVRNESGANIVGLKKEDGTYLINPGPDESLSTKDQLFVLGTSLQIEKLKRILESE